MAWQDLERAVLLLLEGLVGLGRVVERDVVRREVLDAERVVVADPASGTSGANPAAPEVDHA
jgi:hypothetical protein